MKANPFIICSVLMLGVSASVFAQDKKEGNIQNDDIILEKERKIVLQPQISRNFEPLNEIENTQKGRKMKYEFFDRKWESGSNTLLTTSIIGPREGDELVSSYGPKFKNIIKESIKINRTIFKYCNNFIMNIKYYIINIKIKYIHFII